MGRRKVLGSSFVQWWIDDVKARVVAESGIPSDRWHAGKLILQSLKDAGDFELLIDAATGQKKTARELLHKSVKCASALKKLGLGVGDVIVVMAPNHTDVVVPMYAAMYLGLKLACVDRLLGVKELVHSFGTSEPKVIFAQSENVPHIEQALNELQHDATVIAFDKPTFNDLLEKDDTKIADFKCNNFDAEQQISLLIATSGTTGLPKCAAVTHLYLITSLPYSYSAFESFPTPTRMVMCTSPLQWVSAIMPLMLSPILRFTTVSSSSTMTQEHIHEIISKYKPTFCMLSPTSLISLIRKANAEQKENFRSFEVILLGGSAVSPDVCREFKEISPDTQLVVGYGASEVGICHLGYDASQGLHFRQIGLLKYKLVDPDTGKEITKPNVAGELWLQGPPIFKEYYRNPEATKEAFTEDGWFKTGDLLSRDEHQNYYFVDRLKMMLKYKSHQISPVELEGVIRGHPSVVDAAVTGLPDPECGDLSVALVVRRSGHHVTEREIKDLVKNSLSENKQLFGGVYFIESLPMTPSFKVDRRKIKEVAIALDKSSNRKGRAQ